MPIGLLLKFTGLYRLAYLNRGYLSYLLWGGISAATTAGFRPIPELTDSFGENLVLYLFPTMCLLAGIFSVAARLLPELTVVIDVADFLRERLEIIKIRDLPADQSEF